jgi:hypothetical protein
MVAQPVLVGMYNRDEDEGGGDPTTNGCQCCFHFSFSLPIRFFLGKSLRRMADALVLAGEGQTKIM